MWPTGYGGLEAFVIPRTKRGEVFALIGSFSGAPVEIGTGVAVVAEKAFFIWTGWRDESLHFVCADFGQLESSVPGKLAEWGVVLHS
jgi:hypothetical protein